MIAAEGGAATTDTRFSALQTVFPNLDQLPLAVLPMALDLLSQTGDIDRLLSVVAAVTAQRGPIALIIVDTLSRVIAGADENSAPAMTGLIRNLDRVREASGGHVMIIHHAGKSDGNRLRGHSSLFGAIDTHLVVEDGRLTVEAQRDLPSGDVFGFELQSVETGRDAEGEPVTSCVVVDVEVPAGPPARGSARKNLPSATQRVLDALAAAMAAEGTPAPSGVALEGVDRVVTLRSWKLAHRAQAGTDATPKVVDALRKSFDRGRDQLLNEGYIATQGDNHWIVGR